MGNPNTTSVQRPNECDVITIFPMGVNCIVQNPSNDRAFDGAAALVITGGTPPYSIQWEIESFAPAIANLGVGEYSATVIDYYGDFTANTTCVLTAETLTISGMCFVVTGIVEDQLVYISTESLGLRNGKPYYFLQYGTQELGYVFWNTQTNEWYFCQTLDCQTYPYNVLGEENFYPTGTTGSWVIAADTSILITESYVGSCEIPIVPQDLYDLCLNLEVRETKGETITVNVIQVDFTPAGIINGQESWTSTTQYLLYWNTGSTPSQWTITGYSPTTLLINNDPSYPPLSNWQVLGNPSVTDIGVREGLCSSGYTVFVTATDNDAVCGGSGSITVSASGGFSPYQYSVDGGQTYQLSPIFNGLVPGTYSVVAQDDNGVTGTFGNVVITNTPPTTYQLALNFNFTNNTFSITAPTLPGGVTISVDLVFLSLFTYYPINLLPVPTYNNITTIGGSYTMTLTNVTTNVIPLTGPCTADGVLSALQVQRTYTNTITLGSNQTITGSTTNSIINDPTGNCEDAIGYFYLSMTNGIVNGCSCCNVNLINPKPPTPPII